MNTKVFVERAGYHPIVQMNIVASKCKYFRHNTPAQDLISSKRLAQMNTEFRDGSGILVPAEIVKKTFPQELQKKIKVISLVTNFKQEIINKKFEKTVLIVGGPTVRKGLERVVFDDDIKYTLVMSKSRYGDFLVKKMSVNNLKVHNTMPRKSLRGLYKQHNFLIFPSVDDGFGMVVLEAFSLCCVPLYPSMQVYQRKLKNFSRVDI